MKKMKKILALILVMGMLLVSVAVPASAQTEAVAYPNTDAFSWGINGHGPTMTAYDSVPVEKQLELAAKMGVKLYRVGISTYDQLVNIDPLVMAANSYGMDVMLCVTVPTNLTADEIGKRFGAIAKHYNFGNFGRVKYIEIFNETENLCQKEGGDLSFADGYDTAKIADMATKMKAAADAVKAVSTDFLTVVNYGYLHDPYLSLLVDAGLSFDIIDLHWYSGMETVRSQEGGLNDALSRLDSDANLKDKPVILGEIGVASTSQDIKGSETMTDELATIMQKAYNSDKVIGAIFYELLDNGEGFGFVNYDTTNGLGAVKSIYTSVQTAIGGSNDVTPSGYNYTADYPAVANCKYNNPHNTGVSLDLSSPKVSGSWSEGGRKSFEAVDITKYDYVEFDVFVESDTQYGIKFSSKNSTDNCIQINTSMNRMIIDKATWVHQVISLSEFVVGSGSPDKTQITSAYISALDSTGVDNSAHIRNLCFTKFAPEMNNIYNQPLSAGVSLEYTNSGWGEGGEKNLATSVKLNSYDYVEYDVYVRSNDNVFKYGLMFKDDKGTAATFADAQNRKSVSELGKWEHVVVPVSDFTNNGITVKTAYIGATYNTVNIVNICFTKFTPEMKNVWYQPLSAGVSLEYTNSGWGEGGDKNIATSVKLNSYDYVEYDVYVRSNDNVLKYGLMFKDDKGNVATFADTQNRKSVSELGKWEHVVVPVSDFTNNGITVKTAYIGATYNTVKIVNLAFTKFAVPEENNTYTFVAKANPNAIQQSGNVGSYVENWPIDASAAEYLEFDVFAESSNSTATLGDVLLYGEGTTKGWLLKAVGTVEANKWVHIVMPISEFSFHLKEAKYAGYTVDMSKFSNMTIGIGNCDLISVANINFTKEAPDIIWGDANGDGEVSLIDLVALKKAVANEQKLANCDFDDDGELTSEDIICIRKYLLGAISSLDPADIA